MQPSLERQQASLFKGSLHRTHSSRFLLRMQRRNLRSIQADNTNRRQRINSKRQLHQNRTRRQQRAHNLTKQRLPCTSHRRATKMSPDSNHVHNQILLPIVTSRSRPRIKRIHRRLFNRLRLILQAKQRRHLQTQIRITRRRQSFKRTIVQSRVPSQSFRIPKKHQRMRRQHIKRRILRFNRRRTRTQRKITLLKIRRRRIMYNLPRCQHLHSRGNIIRIKSSTSLHTKKSNRRTHQSLQPPLRTVNSTIGTNLRLVLNRRIRMSTFIKRHMFTTRVSRKVRFIVSLKFTSLRNFRQYPICTSARLRTKHKGHRRTFSTTHRYTNITILKHMRNTTSRPEMSLNTVTSMQIRTQRPIRLTHSNNKRSRPRSRHTNSNPTRTTRRCQLRLSTLIPQHNIRHNSSQTYKGQRNRRIILQKTNLPKQIIDHIIQVQSIVCQTIVPRPIVPPTRETHSTPT